VTALSLGRCSGIGFLGGIIRNRLGTTESGVRKSVHNRPMWGSWWMALVSDAKRCRRGIR